MDCGVKGWRVMPEKHGFSTRRSSILVKDCTFTCLLFFASRFVLTLSQTTNFRLYQTETLCRQQFSTLMTMAESSPNK